VCGEAVRLLSADIEEKQIVTIVEYHPSIRHVHFMGDIQHLKQIVGAKHTYISLSSLCCDVFAFCLASTTVNFLSNAVKFSPSRSLVTISVTSSDVPPQPQAVAIFTNSLWIRICVRDQGSGLSDEQKQSIFLPFVQIRPGDLDRKRGTGLGNTPYLLVCVCACVLGMVGVFWYIQCRPFDLQTYRGVFRRAHWRHIHGVRRFTILCGRTTHGRRAGGSGDEGGGNRHTVGCCCHYVRITDVS
jgi:hypothetical protein